MSVTHINSHKSDQVIVNELTIRSADRGKKDILFWKNSLMAAESVAFPNRTRLYDLYEDIVIDGHLAGVIAKRMDAVLNKELSFEAKGERVREMDQLIQSLPFRKIVRSVMETLLWGITGIEFIPGKELDFELIPRKHIQPDTGIISLEQGGNDGIAYHSLDNVWVLGEPGDLGLLLKCAPYCLYKRSGLADWAEYIELFGQPVRVIRYDSYDEQTKNQLKQVLDESGSALTLMLPRQAEFEMMDGKQNNGDGNLQLSFIKMMNDELSVVILGNTDTTTSNNSSGYAQSKIHLEQQYEITRSDLAYTAAQLNDRKFLNILSSYGYPADGGRFVFSKDMDIDYLTKRIAIDKEVAAHINIPAGYWYDTYGITEARPATAVPS